MKKILFPFSKKYNNLQNKWWHRFCIVIFTVVVFLSGTSVWQSLNQGELSGYIGCMSYTNTGFSTYGYSAVEKQCESIFPIHSLLNFAVGLFISIFTFYALQLIYYKVILYIVLGNKKAE